MEGAGATQLFWEAAVSTNTVLGEHPVWDDRCGALLWVDVFAGEIHRYWPGLGDEVFARVGSAVGVLALVDGGGYVAATAEGFLFLDDYGTVMFGPLRPPDMDSGIRFNDGACDPWGRFLAGTVATDGRSQAGKLYRLDHDLRIAVVIDGVTESNGIGWSPDGGTMYYVDSGEPDPVVRAFSYDREGHTLERVRVLVRVPREWGIPDGLVVDSEGCLWVAFWGGGAVRRFSASGQLLSTAVIPVSFPTCPTFAGEGLHDLYVTTARDDSMLDEPGAGSVFRASSPVTGLPANRFGRSSLY
ncbi:MAG: SMP-30/gluconolactonase/LRE family protein [Actinomycetota bacterium]|jgi:sugar lactone lactonase YvrE|uniref:SMP-30/gluconolactonase/LRE family protein n=1 Tax=Ferrimicrobium sp. TaxID=2926050 RepID=UPI00232296D3|nr:SMP-30/gluconolactonase/LRE family protein [Ferrimicrobium sp.]MDA8400736.1 SMP-30/gluconolactonase/LRE family protein [Actinomycetota bacterium]